MEKTQWSIPIGTTNLYRNFVQLGKISHFGLHNVAAEGDLVRSKKVLLPLRRRCQRQAWTLLFILSTEAVVKLTLVAVTNKPKITGDFYHKKSLPLVHVPVTLWPPTDRWAVTTEDGECQPPSYPLQPRDTSLQLIFPSHEPVTWSRLGAQGRWPWEVWFISGRLLFRYKEISGPDDLTKRILSKLIFDSTVVVLGTIKILIEVLHVHSAPTFQVFV